MKEKSISDLSKETRDKLDMWFNADWKLKCPPTWKEGCEIENQDMLELVRKIYIVVDQPWNDWDAHIVSLLINNFIMDINKD